MTTTFTVAETIELQRALRLAAGLPDEQFSIEDVISMVSDEIEVLYERGVTDGEIVAIITEATGKVLSDADVADNFVSSDPRHE